MGLVGYLSCIAGSGTADERAAVVVDWEGSLLRHEEVPGTVAELMMEAPGHLIASAEVVRKTRRALAMRADEALRPGGVYLMFPAGRAGSRVPDRQMEVLDGACGAGKRRGDRKARRRAAAGKRVFPGVVACEEEEEGKELVEEEGKRKGGDTNTLFAGKGDDGGFPCCRSVGFGRPWRPVLEPIQEST